jgi:hypothetical protein
MEEGDAMSNEAIRDLLQKLHTTLGGATSITGEDRELLKQLAADIQTLLAQPADVSHATRQSITDRLVSAVTRFEVSHPDLTATLTQVSNKLGDMGI